MSFNISGEIPEDFLINLQRELVHMLRVAEDQKARQHRLNLRYTQNVQWEQIAPASVVQARDSNEPEDSDSSAWSQVPYRKPLFSDAAQGRAPQTQSPPACVPIPPAIPAAAPSHPAIPAAAPSYPVVAQSPPATPAAAMFSPVVMAAVQPQQTAAEFTFTNRSVVADSNPDTGTNGTPVKPQGLDKTPFPLVFLDTAETPAQERAQLKQAHEKAPNFGFPTHNPALDKMPSRECPLGKGDLLKLAQSAPPLDASPEHMQEFLERVVFLCQSPSACRNDPPGMSSTEMAAFYYVICGALKGVNLKAGEKIPLSTQKLAKHLKIKTEAGLLTGTSNSDYNLFVAYCILFIHMQQDAIASAVAWNGRKQLSGQSVADFAAQVIDGADKLPKAQFASEEDKQGKIAEVFRTNSLPHFQDRIADCKSGHVAGITYTIEDYVRIATGLEDNLAKDLAAQQRLHLDAHARQASRVNAVAVAAPTPPGTPQQQVEQLQQLLLFQQQQFQQQMQQQLQQQQQRPPTNIQAAPAAAAAAADNSNATNPSRRQREQQPIICTKCNSTQRLGTVNKFTNIPGHVAENCPSLSYPDGVICKYCKANHHVSVCQAPSSILYRARIAARQANNANAGAAAPPFPPVVNVAPPPAQNPAGAPAPYVAPAAANAAAANTRPPPPGAPKSG